MRKIFVAATVTAMALAGSAGAQTRLDVAIFHPENDAFTGAFNHWAEKTSELTEGRVELVGHFNSSLVRITDGLAAARDGIVPIATSAAGVVSGEMPAMAFLEVIGGIPGDREESIEVGLSLDDTMRDMFDAAGVDYLWMQPAFGGLVACRDEHLRAPEDWQGRLVRTAGRWQSEQLIALGAVPVTIDPAEQYVALRQGTVDCVLSNNTLFLGLRLHEVAPMITQLRQPVNVMFYLADPRTIAGLSEADQAALREAALSAQQFSTNYLLDRQDEASETMRSEGADIYTLSDEELDAFRETVRPVLGMIAEAAGESGQPLWELLEPSWQ